MKGFQFYFNFDKQSIFIDKLDEYKNKEDIKKLVDKLETNYKQITSPKKKNKKKKNEVSYQPMSIVNNIDLNKIQGILNGSENLYSVYGIQNYSLGVVCYKIELDFFKIIRNPINDVRRIGELVDLTETDTVLSDAAIDLDDKEENNEVNTNDKNKIEIKKSLILSKSIKSDSSSALYLKISSFLFIMLHIVLSLISYLFYSTSIDYTSDLILGYSYLRSQYNLTVTSVDTLLDLIVVTNPYFSSLKDKSQIELLYYQYLTTNSDSVYELNRNFNSIYSIFSNNNTITSNLNQIISFQTFTHDNIQIKSYNKNLTITEGIIEAMSSLFSISKKADYNIDIQTPEVLYFITNVLNTLYYSLTSILNSYVNYFDNISQSSHYIILITAGIVNIIGSLIIYFVLIATLTKMNIILLEFLSIKPQEAQKIIKKCENFIKNVRINNTEDEDEDEKDEDLQNLKRDNKSLREKLKQSKNGYYFIIFTIVLVVVILMIYYIIMIVLYNNYTAKAKSFINLYNKLDDINIYSNLINSEIKLLALNSNMTINKLSIQDNIDYNFDMIKATFVDFKIFLTQDYISSRNFTDILNNQLLINLNNSTLLSISANNTISPNQTTSLYSNTNTYSYVINELINNKKILYNEILYRKQVYSDPNQVFTALNLPYFSKIHYLDNIVVDKIIEVTKKILFEDISITHRDFSNFNLVLFISYTLIALVIYLLIWKPLEIKISKDFTKTKLLILLIPTKLIMKRPKLLDVLKKENLVSIKK